MIEFIMYSGIIILLISALCALDIYLDKKIWDDVLKGWKNDKKY